MKKTLIGYTYKDQDLEYFKYIQMSPGGYARLSIPTITKEKSAFDGTDGKTMKVKVTIEEVE